MEEVKSRGPYIYSVLESAQAFLTQHPFEEVEESNPDEKGLPFCLSTLLPAVSAIFQQLIQALSECKGIKAEDLCVFSPWRRCCTVSPWSWLLPERIRANTLPPFGGILEGFAALVDCAFCLKPLDVISKLTQSLHVQPLD